MKQTVSQSSGLDDLIGRYGLRRGRDQAVQAALATGHAGLDAYLPGGGLPCGALTEIVAKPAGCGELRLLLPLLAARTDAQARIALIDTPYAPHAPAFDAAGVQLDQVLVVRADTPAANLWAAEQLLRSPLFGAVLCWTHASAKAVRRLQVAAETGGGVGVLYGQNETASTAALRLAVTPSASGVRATVRKCRGPAGAVVDCVFDGPAGTAINEADNDVAVPASAALRA